MTAVVFAYQFGPPTGVHNSNLLEFSPKINCARLQFLGKILMPKLQILYADQHICKHMR